MFDMHYDLLSVAYCCYLKKDFSYLEEWCKAYRENNVKGVIANLYFMSKEEMSKELHPDYYRDDVSVVEMFSIATDIVKNMLGDTEVLFSIEGCDFLEVEDLDKLYKLGLRNILPVWNCKNQYASGNRSDTGLTDKGRKLLDKAIELGISIDLSHANDASFHDMIEYLKEKKKEGKKFLVMASHSNSRNLCERARNLTDEEVLLLKEVDGMVGVFENRNFIFLGDKKDSVSQEEKESEYLKHISHMVDLVGTDHVGVATDDMGFCADCDPEYGEIAIFPYPSIAGHIYSLLKSKYSSQDVSQIMYGNMKRRYDILTSSKKKGMKI